MEPGWSEATSGIVLSAAPLFPHFASLNAGYALRIIPSGGLSEASPPNIVLDHQCCCGRVGTALRAFAHPTVYCFRYPFFRSHSIKIFSTKEETVRKRT